MKNTLHILTKQQIPPAIANVDASSAIVLLEDATYFLLNKPTILQEKKLYVLDADLEARSIEHKQAEIINYRQLVKLIIQYQNNITW